MNIKCIEHVAMNISLMIWWWFWEPTLLASITVSHCERKGRSETILIPVPSNTWNQNKWPWLWTVYHMWWVRSKLLFLLFFLKSPSRLWKCLDICSASSSWTKPRQHKFWTSGKCYWSMSRHDKGTQKALDQSLNFVFSLTWLVFLRPICSLNSAILSPVI